MSHSHSETIQGSRLCHQNSVTFLVLILVQSLDIFKHIYCYHRTHKTTITLQPQLHPSDNFCCSCLIFPDTLIKQLSRFNQTRETFSAILVLHYQIHSQNTTKSFVSHTFSCQNTSFSFFFSQWLLLGGTAMQGLTKDITRAIHGPGARGRAPASASHCRKSPNSTLRN
jgi:uncharacterized membrane protein